MVLRKIVYDWLEKYLKPTAGKTCISRENNIWLQKFGTEISRNPTIKPTSSVLPMMFSKLQTSTLLKVCKVHNMSPLAVLQAASITVLGQELSMPKTEIEFGCTVSYRSLSKSHDDIVQQQIAPYISYLACKVTTPENLEVPDFWAIARACHAVVHDNLAKHYEEQIYDDSYLHTGFENEDIFSEINIRSKELVLFNNIGKMAMLERDCDDVIQLKEILGGTSHHTGP